MIIYIIFMRAERPWRPWLNKDRNEWIGLPLCCWFDTTRYFSWSADSPTCRWSTTVFHLPSIWWTCICRSSTRVTVAECILSNRVRLNQIKMQYSWLGTRQERSKTDESTISSNSLIVNLRSSPATWVCFLSVTWRWQITITSFACTVLLLSSASDTCHTTQSVI